MLGHTSSLPLAHLPALTSTCIAIWLSHFSSPRRTVCCISPISTQSPSVPYWRLQCQFTSVVWIVWLDHHRHPNRPGMSRYAAHCRRLHTLAIRRLQSTPSCPIFECPTGEYPLSVLHPVPDSAYRRSLSVNTTLRRRCQPTLCSGIILQGALCGGKQMCTSSACETFAFLLLSNSIFLVPSRA